MLSAVRSGMILQSRRDSAGSWSLQEKIRFSVENDGSHIPDEIKDKIWTEAFTTYPDSSENSGLGLYIVKEIALIEHTQCGFDNTETDVRFRFDFIDYPDSTK